MSGRGEGVLVLLVLAAFAGLCLWIVLRVGTGEQEYPVVSTYSPDKAGTKALYELLQIAGIKTERFGDTEYEYPQGGCMLLLQESTVDPAQMMFGQLDVTALSVWLEDGGTLVLACPPASTEYSPWESTGQQLLDYLDGQDVWSGDPFDTPPPATTKQQPATDQPAALAEAPYKGAGLAGSNTAIYRSYRPGCRYELAKPLPRAFADVHEIETAEGLQALAPHVVPLLSTGTPPLPLVLFRQVGEGRLYWVTRPELFTNDWLPRADNHRLVLALLAQAAQERPLYVDEHIHGYARERANAGSMLFSTLGGRLILGAGLACIACFIGAAVRPARFQPQPPPPRRTALEMVEAQAGLYRRAGLRRGVVERLIDGVRRTYMRTYAHSAIPSNEVLRAWLHGYDTAGITPARFMLVYLQSGAVPRGQTELLRLARACDWAREQLEKERNS